MRKIFNNKKAVAHGLESIAMFAVFFVVSITVLATISDPFAEEQMLSKKQLDSLASEITEKFLSTAGLDKSGSSDWEKHIISVEEDIDSISYIGLAPNPTEVSLGDDDFVVLFGSSSGNTPPEQPVLTGATNVLCDAKMQLQPNVPYKDEYWWPYFAIADDPDGDYLKYEFDWGDGEEHEIIGDEYGRFIPPNTNCSVLHHWGNDLGNYTVRVKAHDTRGGESPWSEPLIVTVHDDPDIWFMEYEIPPQCCFLSGTKISMADGTYKNIEAVEVGDFVKSFDEEKGSIVNSKVLELQSPPREGYYDLYYGKNQIVKITNEHPLYTMKPDGSIAWCSLEPEKTHEYYPYLDFVGKLSTGDKIFTEEGSWVEVTGYNYVKKQVETYNLKCIENTYTYFANGLLAHNRINPNVKMDKEDREEEEGSPTPNNPTCFLAGTKIVMDDGTYKNIEDINIGDKVKSYNEESQTITTGEVVTVFNHKESEMTGQYLIINNDLKVTTNHPIYKDGKWIDAVKLKIGDKINLENDLIEITSIEKVCTRVPTYNFEVKTYHTYMVKLIDNDLVVHNKGSTNGMGHVLSHCFGAKTKIVMADSSELKNIEDIKVNDRIKAFDEKTGEYVEDEIVGVFHDSPEEMNDEFYLRINDKLDVTAEHRLYIDSEWKPAGELKIGDKFTDKNNVKSIEKIMERIPTFNLDSKTYNNFVVSVGSDEFIIAHNDDIQEKLAEQATNLYLIDGYGEGVEGDSETTVISKDIIGQDYLISTAKVEALALKVKDEVFYEQVLKKSLNLGSDVEIAIEVYDGFQTHLSLETGGDPSTATLVSSQQRTALSFDPADQEFGNIYTLKITLYKS